MPSVGAVWRWTMWAANRSMEAATCFHGRHSCINKSGIRLWTIPDVVPWLSSDSDDTKPRIQPYVECLTEPQWQTTMRVTVSHATWIFGWIQMHPLMVAGGFGCPVTWRTGFNRPFDGSISLSVQFWAYAIHSSSACSQMVMHPLCHTSLDCIQVASNPRSSYGHLQTA